MESNEGILPWQMCPLCNTVLPRHRKTDQSETSAGKQPLPALIKLCVCVLYKFQVFFFSPTEFASCCCTPGNRSKSHYDIAPRVTLNDKSTGSVSQAQNLLPGHLLHWGVKLFELSPHYRILKCIIVRAFMVCRGINSICPIHAFLIITLSSSYREGSCWAVLPGLISKGYKVQYPAQSGLGTASSIHSSTFLLSPLRFSKTLLPVVTSVSLRIFHPFLHFPVSWWLMEVVHRVLSISFP